MSFKADFCTWELAEDTSYSDSFVSLSPFDGMSINKEEQKEEDADAELELIPEEEDLDRLDIETIAAKETETLSTHDLEAMAVKNLELLKKMRTGTATKENKRKIRELNEKIMALSTSTALNTAKREKSSKMRTEVRKKEKELELRLREREIRNVMDAVANAEKVDLAFMVDCTGSMGCYISAVKDQIKLIVKRVKSTNPSLDLRLSFLGYRDLEDTNQFEIFDFSRDHDAFSAFVGAIVAGGGGDAPEDIAGALGQLILLSWNHNTKIMFHIADCPCHGEEYHSYGLCGDSHPTGGPSGSKIGDYLATIQQEGIFYYFGRITSATDIMIEKFNMKMGKDFITTVAMESSEKIVSAVTSSVRTSIHVSALKSTKKTVTFADKKRSKLGSTSSDDMKKYVISSAEPDWAQIRAQKVNVFTNVPVNSIRDLRKPKIFKIYLCNPAATGATRTKEMTVKIADQPFAEGELRIAYRGYLYVKSGEHSVVLKEFKQLGPKAHDISRYMAQIEISTIASFLAEEYNKIRSPDLLPVKVVVSRIVEAEHHKKEKESRFYCMEKPLHGEFIKFSNNTGFWDEDHLDETLLRYSKYTLEATKGYMMVVDLQGIKCEGGYILTDPVILCCDILRFGSTNLGGSAMKRCNDALEAYLKYL